MIKVMEDILKEEDFKVSNELKLYQYNNNGEFPDWWILTPAFTEKGLENAMERYANLKIEEYKNSDEALIDTARVWWRGLNTSQHINYCDLFYVIDHWPTDKDILKAWRHHFGKE